MSVEHATVDGKDTKVKLFLWFGGGQIPAPEPEGSSLAPQISLAPDPLTRSKSARRPTSDG
jgi:hypothetical protein